MSEENRKTVAAYEQAAQKFLDNAIAHDALDPDKAKRKRAKLNDALRRAFSTLPEGAKIIEIGAAGGDNSAFLQSIGYDVLATDVAPAFIEALKKRDLKTQTFNALTDNFPSNISGILAWRVLVHFTHEDIALFLGEAYNALRAGGRLVFNVIDIATHDSTGGWEDFIDEWKMGVERYYAYYNEEEIRQMIVKTRFKIVDNWHEHGGHNDWFVFVLEK